MSEISSIKEIREDRALSDKEVELVRWLLSNGKEGAASYLPQVEKAWVISRCGCGCASVDFSVDGVVTSRKMESKLYQIIVGEPAEKTYAESLCSPGMRNWRGLKFGQSTGWLLQQIYQKSAT